MFKPYYQEVIVLRWWRNMRIYLALPPRTKLKIKIKRGTSTQNKTTEDYLKRSYLTKDGQKPP